MRAENLAGSQNIASPLLCKTGSAPLANGREWDFYTALPRGTLAKMLFQSKKSAIMIFQRPYELPNNLIHRNRKICQRQNLAKTDLACRNRACFIETQRIYPRQRFNAIQILYQRFLFAKRMTPTVSTLLVSKTSPSGSCR